MTDVKKGQAAAPPSSLPKKAPTMKEMMRAKGYIPVSEAAKRCGRSVYYIYELLDTGKVHGVSDGRGAHARRFVEVRSLIEHLGPEMAKLLGLV